MKKHYEFSTEDVKKLKHLMYTRRIKAVNKLANTTITRIPVLKQTENKCLRELNPKTRVCLPHM